MPSIVSTSAGSCSPGSGSILLDPARSSSSTASCATARRSSGCTIDVPGGRGGHGLRHGVRAAGVRLLPGLHRVRRVVERGLRREDLQDHGHGGEGRLPRRRASTTRAAPASRRACRARRVRRDLLRATLRPRAWCPRSRSSSAPAPAVRSTRPPSPISCSWPRERRTCSSPGPDVVKTVTREDVTRRSSAARRPHASKSGVAHFVAPGEEAVIEDACGDLLSYPAAEQPRGAAVRRTDDPVDREAPELDTLVPDAPEQAVRHAAR